MRGMRDMLPADYAGMAQVQARLLALLASHGYTQIDLPVVEHRDLYLRKTGEDLAGKIYEFSFGGRELVLRPEWTASVLRSYVTHMQDQPLPLRLSYGGPVFRYQRPQRLTYRQFSQVGVELIGGPSPRADAEVLTLASSGLSAIGIPDYEVRLAHIGVVRELLAHVELAERTRGLLLWSLERMRSQGVEAVRTHLFDLMGDTPIDPSLLETLTDEQVSTLLLRMLQTMGVSLSFGTRSADAIINRMVRKLRRSDTPERLERALDFLWRLSQIRGEPHDALCRARAILDEAGIDSPSLNELQSILAMLDQERFPGERVVLDFGMGRGLHYYTGLIFEVYDSTGMQVCGGGRYDDLVQVLGGRQSVPAVGFSYGLERVVAACAAGAGTETRQHEVLVSPITDSDYPYAQEIAERLRSRGMVVTVDIRGRSVSGNLRDAARRGIPYVAIVGPEERARHEMVWHTMTTRQEQRISIQDIARFPMGTIMKNQIGD